MAKPRYIVCSQDRLVDQATGAVTHVNVVEKFVIKLEPAPEPPPGTQYLIPKIPIFKMILTAVWAREQDDSDSDDFEFEAILHKPSDEIPFVLHRGEFRFLAGASYFRIDSGIIFTTETKFTKSGAAVFENRIRKRGSDNWLSQQFPMEIEVISPEAANPSESNAHTTNQ